MTVVEQFGLFVERADELGRTAIVRKSGLDAGFNLHFDQTGGRYSFRQPDEEHLRSFLLTFRQFVMNDEPVFIRRILALAHQHIQSDELRARATENAQIWKRILKSCGFNLVIRDQQITPEYALDLYINGQYFHNDGRKRAELQRFQMPENLLVKSQFIAFLGDATMVIARVRWILRAALYDGAVSQCERIILQRL